MKTIHPQFTWKTISVFVFSAFFLSACEEKVIEPDIPYVEEPLEKTERGVKIEESGIHIDMPESSLFVKEDINKYLIEYDERNGRLVFQTCNAIDNAGIKEGDVLFSGVIPEKAPEGYLVKVNKITRTNSRTTFETSKAGLGDAFEDLSFDYSLESIQLSPENITVYDPFTQDNLMPYEDPMTRGLSIDLDTDFSKEDFQLKGDKFILDLDLENHEISLEIVVLDMDDDYKNTKNDQARLEFKIEYELEDGEFRYSKGGEDGFVNAGMKIKLGGFAGLKFGKEKKNPGEKEIINALDKKALNDYKTKVEEKLMGKKIRVWSWEIPLEGIPAIGPVLAAVISPRIDLYFVYNIKLDGAFRVGFVWEKAEFDYHSGNSSDDFTATNEKQTWFNVDKADFGDIHFDVLADADVKGSIGAGFGLVMTTSKKLDFLFSDEENKPFVGAFFEFTGNADFKFESDFNLLDQVLEGTISGHYYFQTEAFLEAYARAKPKILGTEYDLLWHFKKDWPRLSYKIPDPPKEFISQPFKIESDQPIPYCVSPENRAIIRDEQVDLNWAIPLHMNAGTAEQGLFDGITYTVYAGTDRVLVEQSSPQVRVASDIPKGEKHFTLSIDPLKTYYWKVICTNQYGYDYTSQVWSFDTGYDGIVRLNKPLGDFLSDNWTVLDGVRIEPDGIIYRTPSNLLALSKIKELVIQDPEGKYGINTLDDLLAHLPSLEILNCNNNDIRLFDFSHNPKLKGLSCRNNSLMEIDLQSLPNLEGLNCGDNEGLTELDLSPAPNLQAVRCDNCMISSIDLSNNLRLQDLYASENHLAELDISRCSHLLRLDVYSQSVELLKLRLTHAQMDGDLVYFKRHFNMEFEFVDVNGILTEVLEITDHSAVIKVSALDRKPYPFVGLLYSHLVPVPDRYSDYTERMVVYDQLSATFTLEDLRPDFGYYVRGYSIIHGEINPVFGNVVHFKTLPAAPAPQIKTDPEEYEFDPVDVGTSAFKDITVTNTGTLDLVYEFINTTGAPFTVRPTGQQTLKPNESDVITITFAPRKAGDYKGEFIIRSNDPRGDLPFDVWGTGDNGFQIVTPEIVDLGLSVHWASFNLGATEPKGLGGQFSQGESYHLDPYLYDYWGRTLLVDQEEDAAYLNLGGYWRMPSWWEWRELYDACDKTWYSNYVQLTSRTNGRSIYLPITTYWSSTYDNIWGSFSVIVDNSHIDFWDTWNHTGPQEDYAIRPVYYIPIENVSLNISEVEINNFEREVVLKATILPADAMFKEYYWDTDTGYSRRDLYGRGRETVTIHYHGGNESEIISFIADDVKSEAKIEKCKIVIKTYIEGVELIDHQYLITGESVTLNPVFYPTDAFEHPDHLEWVSDNPSIATVADGKVTGIKVGTTIIRVRYESLKNSVVEATCRITVSNPPGSHEGLGIEYWD